MVWLLLLLFWIKSMIESVSLSEGNCTPIIFKMYLKGFTGHFIFTRISSHWPETGVVSMPKTPVRWFDIIYFFYSTWEILEIFTDLKDTDKHTNTQRQGRDTLPTETLSAKDAALAREGLCTVHHPQSRTHRGATHRAAASPLPCLSKAAGYSLGLPHLIGCNGVWGLIITLLHRTSARRGFMHLCVYTRQTKNRHSYPVSTYYWMKRWCACICEKKGHMCVDM